MSTHSYRSSRRVAGISAAFILALGSSARAVDGVVEINQAKALAGGVTAGDTAGFPATISQSGSYRLTGNLTVPDADTEGARSLLTQLAGARLVLGPTPSA